MDIYKNISKYLLALTFIASCSTTSDEKKVKTKEELIAEEIALVKKMAHPTYTTKDSTQSFVLTNMEDLDISKLEQCSQNLEKISAASDTQEKFFENRQRLIDEVRNSVKFFHICFYFSLSRLDREIYEDRLGTGINAIQKNFNQKITGLLLLSVSLGNILGSNYYFDFLRARYIKLSYTFFGRRLDILDQQPAKGQKQGLKPAGDWQEED